MTQPQNVAGKELVGPLDLTFVGPLDLTDEEWREYDFGGRVYRINNPVALFYRIGGTTHRVVDKAGETHCVPVPGHEGCVLRWFAPKQAVSF